MSSLVATTPAQERRRPGLSLLLIALFFVVLTVRRPEGLLHPTIWAEDGWLFLPGAFAPGGHFTEVYGGQVWPLQRLLALIVSQAPATWWPLLLYLISNLVVALAVGVVLLRRAVTVFGTFWWRAAIAFGLVLMPGVWEVQGNLANVHWWATIGAMVALALPAPRATAGRALELALLVVVGATGMGALLVLPVAIWRIASDREEDGRGYLWLRSATVGVLALINVALALQYSNRAGAADVGAVPADMAQFVVKRVGGTFVFGERGMLRWAAEGPLSGPIQAAALLLLALVLALILTDLRGPSWAWAATGLGCILLAIAGTSTANFHSMLTAHSAGRYAVLGIAATVLIVGRALATGSGPRRMVAVLALMIMVPGFLFDLALPLLGAPVERADLARLQDCLDGQAPGPAMKYCAVGTAPKGWQMVIWR